MLKFSGILTLLFLGLNYNSYSQGTTDEQLASHYYQIGEFDKAILYYEKLYKKKPTDFYYNYLFNSCIKIQDYKWAEKLAKKHAKSSPQNPKYKIDLGSVYQLTGNQKKSNQVYERLIKEVPASQNAVIQLASSFKNKDLIHYALQTYEKGRKMLKGQYTFNMELADIYYSQGKFNLMIKEYLNMLDINKAYLQAVQSSLNRNMGFEKNSQQNQLLKTELLKRIQKSPGNKTYAEMLIWMYIQQKKFNLAFVQAKALDKRHKEKGGRILSLGKLCASNRNYNTAIEAYQYLIKKGRRENPFYIKAKSELLSTLHKKITGTPNYTKKDLFELESNYYSTLEELGKNRSTISLIRSLAQLQSHYLHNTDTAISLLEEAVALPAIDAQNKAQCKLDLGDILVMQGNIWDAALLYGQVDKDFKFDPLGWRAKYKHAKVFYYAGQFKFAKGMLDVLKGATAKLIANDAMELSLRISDNTGIDTTETPMLMFANAELLSAQNKDSLALITLDSINSLYKGHALEDDILLQRSKIALKQRKYGLAADFLQKIIDDYSWDILADNAIFSLAEINQYHLNNPNRAKDLYQKLLFDFSGSLYVVEARKRFRELRGDELNNP